MNESQDEATLRAGHIAARNDVIAEYGHLWRQAIEKSGIRDETTIAELLQVCAACYLDGVHQGSRLTIEQIAKDR
jgi:hypothetical protein